MYKVKVCIKTNQNLLSSRISIDRMHFIWYGFFFFCSHLLIKSNVWNKCYPLVFNCTDLYLYAWRCAGGQSILHGLRTVASDSVLNSWQSFGSVFRFVMCEVAQSWWPGDLPGLSVGCVAGCGRRKAFASLRPSLFFPRDNPVERCSDPPLLWHTLAGAGACGLVGTGARAIQTRSVPVISAGTVVCWGFHQRCPEQHISLFPLPF